MAEKEQSSVLRKLLLIVGVVAFVSVAYVAGCNKGKRDQLRGDNAGNLAISVHLYRLAEAGNTEKLMQNLQFMIFAQYDVHERLSGGVALDEASSGQARMLETAQVIHSLMKTQVVSFTPNQLMERVNAGIPTNPPTNP